MAAGNVKEVSHMNVVAGQIVRVRSRREQYLVEDIVHKPQAREDNLVRLSCLEDDALGEPLEVLWERKVDAKIVGTTSWESIANRGFDCPACFLLTCIHFVGTASRQPIQSYSKHPTELVLK